MLRMRGFSMIELLVALALGLLITAAGTQLFLSSSITSSFQRSMNEVQSSGRFAMDQITRDVRLAGLQTDTKESLFAGFPITATEIKGLASGSTKVNSNGTQTDGLATNASDQLVVQYYAPYDTTDCEGTAVAKGLLVVNRYFLRQDADSQTQSLACDGGQYVLTPSPALVNYDATDTGVVLVTGVDSFQVLYGIDDGVNKQPNVARFITATAYAALSAPRPRILAVRVGILVRTQDRAAGTEGVAPSNDIWVLDRQISSSTAGLADGRIRRLFISTMSVRNADPDEV